MALSSESRAIKSQFRVPNALENEEELQAQCLREVMALYEASEINEENKNEMKVKKNKVEPYTNVLEGYSLETMQAKWIKDMLHPRESTLYESPLELLANIPLPEAPPFFELIDKNLYRCPSRVSEVEAQDPKKCDCNLITAMKTNNYCSAYNGCINLVTHVECDESCALGNKCENRKFLNRQYADVAPKPTYNKGWGLFNKETKIKDHSFIMEYCGEVITLAQSVSRILKAKKTKVPHLYHMDLDGEKVVDASNSGNISRFLNHSCDPNCEIQKWTVGSEKRVGIFSVREILPYEELTIDYQYERVDHDSGIKQLCYCGTAKCQGYIGWKKKGSECFVSNKISKQKKLDRCDNQVYSDSFCYFCGEDDGLLVMCDASIVRVVCPRVYHPHCLDLSSPPKGAWQCPWHYCRECEKPTKGVHFCFSCSDSWCEEHFPGKSFEFVVPPAGVSRDDISPFLRPIEAQDVSGKKSKGLGIHVESLREAIRNGKFGRCVFFLRCIHCDEDDNSCENMSWSDFYPTSSCRFDSLIPQTIRRIINRPDSEESFQMTLIDQRSTDPRFYQKFDVSGMRFYNHYISKQPEDISWWPYDRYGNIKMSCNEFGTKVSKIVDNTIENESSHVLSSLSPNQVVNSPNMIKNGSLVGDFIAAKKYISPLNQKENHNIL